VLSGRGLCDGLITRPEESYRLCCVVVCDLETSRIGAPYIYDISNLRVKCRKFTYFSRRISLAYFFQNDVVFLELVQLHYFLHISPLLSTHLPYQTIRLCIST